MAQQHASSDSGAADSSQGLAAPTPAAWMNPGRGRMRLSTLIALRWRGIIGQAVVLAAAGFVLQGDLPWVICLPLVAISTAVNLLLIWIDRRQEQLKSWEYAAILGFDLLQLTGMLFVTGGMHNPFVILLIAPVVLAAATLPTGHVAGLVAGAFACVLFLALFSWPLPEPVRGMASHGEGYKSAFTIALLAAVGFTASYAWRASSEAEKMEVALSLTEQVLAREQRLSSLGALAAAAAHELGTPLATIQIVSKELARGAKDPALREDAELLVEQAERCREILKRLSETPETTDAMHERLPLRQFLNEVIEPHLGGEIRIEGVMSGPGGAAAPDIRRLPEIFHALNTLIDNAADFAKSEVLVRARFDESAIMIEIHDDGPGFSPEVMAKLGTPYVTTRAQGEGSRSGYVGMGLGFFIAKTLLEKSGATVTHHNARRGGAVVSARWPRNVLEAPALREFLPPGA